jgi:CRP-like cAMP-binding protein
MLSPEELRTSRLFDGISYEEYLAMYSCFRAVSKAFRPDDVICDFGSGCDTVGIVERGEAALVRVDAEGVETVLENLSTGGVFGRTLAFSGSSEDTLEVVCRAPCEVLFIDYAHILKRCERACAHHSMLVQNMLMLMADKAQALSERIDVLSRRSIRDKLLCFFTQQRNKTGRDTFRLPFSLSTLADYIATDRSAMMRELKKMKEERLITSSGREITLLSAAACR